MYDLREYRPLDEDFIYHSWLSSIDHNVDGFRSTTRLVINHCVENKTVKVACSEEDPDHILGWLAYSDLLSDRVLTYFFTKKNLRNNGIATNLFKEAFTPELGKEIPAAYWSFWCQRYDLRKKWGVRFNSCVLPVLVERLVREELEDGSKDTD